MTTPRKYCSTFQSGELACATTLHTPAEDSDLAARPAVLLVHGWGGIQNLLVGPFIETFLALGYAVMTFDYSSWGESEGSPRNVINPWKRVREAELALFHLRDQSGVDPKRIVLWGTSFGGGHVVELAAAHPDLLGVIAQVPMLDGRKSVAAVPFRRLVSFGWSAIADLLNPFRAVYLPIVAPLGDYAAMDRDGAHAAMRHHEIEYGVALDNRIAARSLLTIGFYRPIKKLRRVKVPTLLIGARKDTVAPFVPDAIDKIGNKLVQTKTIDANHFGPYFEPALESNLRHQAEFLTELAAAARR